MMNSLASHSLSLCKSWQWGVIITLSFTFPPVPTVGGQQVPRAQSGQALESVDTSLIPSYLPGFEI